MFEAPSALGADRVSGGVEVAFERIEALRPERADGAIQSSISRICSARTRVEPSLRLDARLDEPGLAQDAQVLGDGGLAQRQSADELADGPLAFTQQIEDSPPVRLGQDFERGHAVYLPAVI